MTRRRIWFTERNTQLMFDPGIGAFVERQSHEAISVAPLADTLERLARFLETVVPEFDRGLVLVGELAAQSTAASSTELEERRLADALDYTRAARALARIATVSRDPFDDFLTGSATRRLDEA